MEEAKQQQDTDLYRHYTTTVHSGISELKAQYSGLRISTVVRAQRFTNHVMIQFEDAKLKNYDNVVVVDHERSLKMHRRNEGLDDVEDIPAAIKDHLEFPFKVAMSKMTKEDPVRGGRARLHHQHQEGRRLPPAHPLHVQNDQGRETGQVCA